MESTSNKNFNFFKELKELKFCHYGTSHIMASNKHKTQEGTGLSRPPSQHRGRVRDAHRRCSGR